jgi:hypothetical protein
VFLWTRRERFATGSVPPNCPEGLTLVGKKCRGDGADMIDGECPEGMMMNEEGMCQRLADPVCPAEYTIMYDDVSVMCEPNTPVQELTDEENQARQNAMTLPQCPAGFTRDQTTSLDNLRCMRDSGQAPVCPAGSTFDRDAYAWSVSEPTGTGVCFSANGPVPAKCPTGTFPNFIYLENAEPKFACVEYEAGAVPSAPAEPPVTPPPAEPPVTPPPVVPPPIAPPPVVTPEAILPPPTPRELVFQPKLLGTPGGSVVPADTRIGELLGGLFSPSEPRPEHPPSEYTL